MTPADLRAWRKAARLSQAELARRLSVDHTTISRWERGTYAIPAYLQLALHGLELPKKRPVRYTPKGVDHGGLNGGRWP